MGMKRIISHSHVSAAFLIAALTFNACTPQSGNTKEANTTSVVQTSVDNLDVKVLKGQYDLNTKLFNNALVNISESEANQQFNGTANNVKRIAGHALFLNYSLANLLTVESQNRSEEHTSELQSPVPISYAVFCLKKKKKNKK